MSLCPPHTASLFQAAEKKMRNQIEGGVEERKNQARCPRLHTKPMSALTANSAVPAAAAPAQRPDETGLLSNISDGTASSSSEPFSSGSIMAPVQVLLDGRFFVLGASNAASMLLLSLSWGFIVCARYGLQPLQVLREFPTTTTSSPPRVFSVRPLSLDPRPRSRAQFSLCLSLFV